MSSGAGVDGGEEVHRVQFDYARPAARLLARLPDPDFLSTPQLGRAQFVFELRQERFLMLAKHARPRESGIRLASRYGVRRSGRGVRGVPPVARSRSGRPGSSDNCKLLCYIGLPGSRKDHPD